MRRLAAAILLIFFVSTVALAAVDTQDRRSSVWSARRMRRVLPVPDASVDTGDRAQVAFAYRGFFDSEEPPPESSGSTSGGRAAAWFILSRRR